MPVSIKAMLNSKLLQYYFPYDSLCVADLWTDRQTSVIIDLLFLIKEC